MHIDKIFENIETKKKEIVEKTTVFECGLLDNYYIADLLFCEFSFLFLLTFFSSLFITNLFFVYLFAFSGSTIAAFMPEFF